MPYLFSVHNTAIFFLDVSVDVVKSTLVVLDIR